jgi:hypothetical protein
LLRVIEDRAEVKILRELWRAGAELKKNLLCLALCSGSQDGLCEPYGFENRCFSGSIWPDQQIDPLIKLEGHSLYGAKVFDIELV